MNIKAENISRQFLRESRTSNIMTAVQETDLELVEGKLIQISGRSGSGKSTLLNMLAGLLTPSTGRVLYDDTDIYLMDDDKRSEFRNHNIGVIPQGHTGLKSLNVMGNVLLPAMMYGKKDDYETRAKELLERMDIAELELAYPDELSGGEMRRLAIARALIMEPKVIFADEPTGDLDDENTHAVLSLLKETAKAGAAVLLITHEKEADAYADMIYNMSDGKLSKI